MGWMRFISFTCSTRASDPRLPITDHWLLITLLSHFSALRRKQKLELTENRKQGPSILTLINSSKPSEAFAKKKKKPKNHKKNLKFTVSVSVSISVFRWGFSVWGMGCGMGMGTPPLWALQLTYEIYLNSIFISRTRVSVSVCNSNSS